MSALSTVRRKDRIWGKKYCLIIQKLQYAVSYKGCLISGWQLQGRVWNVWLVRITTTKKNRHLWSPAVYDEGHCRPNDGQRWNHGSEKQGPVIQGLRHSLLPWFQLGLVEFLQRKTQLLEIRLYNSTHSSYLSTWCTPGLIYDWFSTKCHQSFITRARNNCS